MGASSASIFDDDDGADWIGEFEESPKVSAIKKAFAAVIASGGDLELPECGSAVAAAEVVAALHGQPHPELPEAIRDWAAGRQKSATEQLREQARQALDRVREDSEMQGLWQETDAYDDWLRAIDALKQRLQ